MITKWQALRTTIMISLTPPYQPVHANYLMRNKI